MGRPRPAPSSLAFLLVLAAVGLPSAASALDIRIDGKVLRKATGKVVLSLSAFELQGRRDAILENRRTRERRTVPLATVYEDLSYTEPLPPAEYDALDPDAWIPFVTWSLPDKAGALVERLHEIHAYQNALRRGLGNALLEDAGEAGGRVSSRLAINKIEKFHRIASRIAAEARRFGATEGNPNPFRYPVLVEVGFDPYGRSPASRQSSPEQEARDVLYWEVHRVLTQQFGVDETLVDLVFDAPATVRRIVPAVGAPPGAAGDFVPSVTLAAESIDAALYLQGQGFGRDLQKLVRLHMYAAPFIKDRPALDAFVNEGTVVAVLGRRAAVTFVPPFMKKGETVRASAEGGEIPLVLERVMGVEGYVLTSELEEADAARLRAGTAVRRP